MVARKHPSPSEDPTAEAAQFRLERFTWGAPDRLEVSGAFDGLRGAPSDPPMLVLRGSERTYRLTAGPDDVSGAAVNGEPWHAAFVWREPPAAFQAAALHLGAGLTVELPEPGTDGKPSMLAVVASEQPEAPPDRLVGPGAERLRLHAELLAAEEEFRATEYELRRTQEELSRARADLDGEREARAADALRFREGLERVQASAEEALADQQSAAAQLGADLRTALDEAEGRDGALAQLRGELEAEAATRMRAESELEQLQARIEGLMAAEQDQEELNARLADATAQAEQARREIVTVDRMIDEARADVERLLVRLSGVRGERGEGG